MGGKACGNLRRFAERIRKALGDADQRIGVEELPKHSEANDWEVEHDTRVWWPLRAYIVIVFVAKLTELEAK